MFPIVIEIFQLIMKGQSINKIFQLIDQDENEKIYEVVPIRDLDIFNDPKHLEDVIKINENLKDNMFYKKLH